MYEHHKNDNRKIKGVFLEVGGDMKNDGTIITDKDAIIDVNVRGNYFSDKGKIIQGESQKTRWWNKTWVQLIMLLGAIVSIIGSYFLFFK